MSKGKPYGCQHKDSDLEELQSKSVIRNLLMKRKYNTSPNKKQHTEYNSSLIL